MKENKRVCHQQIYLKRMAKGSSLNRTKMMKEGTLEHQEEENNGKGEIWADKIHLPFSFELFKYV